jgi:hypothetical protein
MKERSIRRECQGLFASLTRSTTINGKQTQTNAISTGPFAAESERGAATDDQPEDLRKRRSARARAAQSAAVFCSETI